MSFRQLISSGKPAILFEIVPPKLNDSPDQIASLVNLASHLCLTGQVQAVNIPEIREEGSSSHQPGRLLPKMAPRVLAKAIINETKNPNQVIINRCVPFLPPAGQKRWLIRTYQNYAVRNLVIVGGLKDPSAYSGWSVLEAAQFINRDLKKEMPEVDYCCGGICIPQRRTADPVWDEPQRLITKAKAGIEFFTTQVIFDQDPVCQLLRDYDQLCQQENERPRMIFLSLAPVSCSQDLVFFQKLGIKFPTGIIQKFNQASPEMGKLSCKLIPEIFSDIMTFMTGHDLKIPIGINLEYITRRNLDLTQKLIPLLKPIVNDDQA